MFDGAQCGTCGEQHETSMHEDCDPRILNYACMLMDRQKEGPAATEKCWLCETGKHHPELCGQLALYDLNTNKPLPQHLRAFALPNLHPEVLTNFPLYYYTGAMVLDAEKNAVLQAFAPPMPAHGGRAMGTTSCGHCTSCGWDLAEDLYSCRVFEVRLQPRAQETEASDSRALVGGECNTSQ
jgi:hypothetical protein